MLSNCCMMQSNTGTSPRHESCSLYALQSSQYVASGSINTSPLASAAQLTWRLNVSDLTATLSTPIKSRPRQIVTTPLDQPQESGVVSPRNQK